MVHLVSCTEVVWNSDSVVLLVHLSGPPITYAPETVDRLLDTKLVRQVWELLGTAAEHFQR